MQVRNWDYVGWSDTKFIKPKDFGALIDLPRFYETLAWINDSEPTQANPEERNQQLTAVNTDSVSTGELLIDFFEFYAFTFDNENQAIDIRYHGSEESKSPFRPREEFVSEAKSEF